MVCKDCHAMFVRRVNAFGKESLTCIWNMKSDGTYFEHSNKVFLVPEDPEKVEFT